MLFEYQRQAVMHILQNPRTLVVLKMGAGKTLICLSAITALLKLKEVRKILIVSTLNVVRGVWPTEIGKWHAFKELRYSVVVGTKNQREQALAKEADIYLINIDNLAWFFRNNSQAIDWAVLDESTLFKNPSTKRFKENRKPLLQIPRVTLLTGTPAAGSLFDLWSQYFLIDAGASLGRAFYRFRNQYFTGDYNGWVWLPKEKADLQIVDKTKHLTFTVTPDLYQASPEIQYIDRLIALPPKVLKQYKKLESTFLLALQKENIEAANAAVLTTKLRQLSNGFLYGEDGTPHELHSEKLRELKRIVEDNRGENILVGVTFKKDICNIQKIYPQAEILDSKNSEIVERWNTGQISLLLANPASAGHGLNLQGGGSLIVWYSLPWSIGLYQQFNARVHRTGQTNNVRVIHLLADTPIDRRVLSVLQKKERLDLSFLQALKEALQK